MSFMIVDLHCHSNYSDGALSPLSLLDLASQASVNMLALTDHDTVAGLDTLHQAARDKQLGIVVVNGVELSVRWKKHDIHVLGLHIDYTDATFLKVIKKQQDSRQCRALMIAKKLKTIGVDDAFAKACAIAGHEQIGRLHFAELLVKEGVTTDIQNGFKRFLGRGKCAFVPTLWIDLAEAVNVIKKAGGDAVIAHPLKYGLTRTKLAELIGAFKQAEGSGLEVISGQMNEAQISETAGLCERFQLLASTGSDFHRVDTAYRGIGGQRQLPINCKPIWQQWAF